MSKISQRRPMAVLARELKLAKHDSQKLAAFNASLRVE